MKWSPLVVSLVGFLLLCCHSPRNARTLQGQPSVESLLYDREHVLVLLLDFTANNATIRSAKLIEGTFEPLAEDLSSDDFVSIQYLDSSDKVLFEKIIDHPLVQYAEYADQDGTIHLRQTIKDKGTIMIRSQHLTNVRKIRVGYGRKKSYLKIADLPIEMSQLEGSL